jgi:tRNA nucleotidyltransferase/poly(A) polymerase
MDTEANILDQVIAFLGDQDADAYLVGGLVRDQLLGRAVKRDIDLAIDGDASELARAFADRHGGAFYLMDAEHDVARVILRDTYIDFAALRGDVRSDLATRDFSINAMARQIGSDELIDPFHGQRDLREKQIRAVSSTVFHDDPVRLLRALRLIGELDFTLEPRTEDLMRGDAPLMAYASMERARDELCKILAQENPVALLRQADDLGMLGALVPELNALKNVTQSPPHAYDVFEHTLHVVDELVKVQARGYTDVTDGEFTREMQTHFEKTVSADHTRGVLLRLAALLHDVAKPETRSVDHAGKIHFYEHEPRGAETSSAILRRLRFSNDEIDLVMRTVANHLRPLLLTREAVVTNRAAYRFFRDAGDAGVDVCILALADQRGKTAPQIDHAVDGQVRAVLTTLLDRYFRTPDTVLAPPVLVDGRELMSELKMEAGPRVGELLEAIREAQAEGEVSTREDALAFVRKLVQD